MSGFKRLRVPVQERLPIASPALPVPAPTDSTMGHKFPKLAKKFLLAGKALFTVDNGKEHYTFKVRRKDSTYRNQPQTTFWLSVKSTHPRAKYGYALIGILNPETGTVKCISKSLFIPGSKEYDVAAWACQVVIRGKMIPERYDIQHAGKCGRCGKKLTDPVSIERGLGPDCWEK